VNRNKKNGILLLVALCLLVCLSTQTAQSQNYASILTKFTTVEQISGPKPPEIISGDNRPWVIILFKACCATNRQAMQWALRAQKTFGDSVHFVGINSDHARALSKVKPWLAGIGVDFTILRDPSHEIINELAIIALPSIIVLSGDGEQALRITGFMGGNGSSLDEKLAELIGKEKTP
jgi:hypothetical protein